MDVQVDEQGCAYALWRAAPHQFGPGKVHVVDRADPARTFCGRLLEELPGKPAYGMADCRSCAKSIQGRHDAVEARAKWEAELLAREQTKALEDADWHRRHEAHLRSPRWRELRVLVMRRSDDVCEGCGTRMADEVHHLSYDHLGDEFLFELVALCRTCHARWHGKVDT